MSEEHTNKIIISGYYGFGNIGDEAILSSMIEQIKLKIHDAIFTVISYDVENTKKLHGVMAIDRLNFKAISHEIEDCKLVILGGGGLFQDHHKIEVSDIFVQPGLGISSYIIVPLLARMHNKPVMYYSQGVGPLFSKGSRTFVAFSSELADIITVRDVASENLLKEIGVPPSKIRLGLDPAFGLEIISSERIRDILMKEEIPSDKDIVSISVRPWIDSSIEESYKKALSESLDIFLDNNNFNILFVPFQSLATYQENDMRVAREIICEMRNKDKCYLLKERYHPREIAGVISTSSLVIGMRYHSIIFSVISKVPFVALSYDPKVKNLVDELGLGEYCIEIDLITPENVNKAITGAMICRDKIQEKLELFIDDMKRRLELSPSLTKTFIEDSSMYEFKIDIPVKVEKMTLLNTVHSQAQAITNLESLLKNRDNDIAKFQEIVTNLESQLRNKDDVFSSLESQFQKILYKKEGLDSDVSRLNLEISRLQEILIQRESSLSWKFSQFYGKYFRTDSYITRFISHFLNKALCSSRNRQIKKDNIHKQELKNILKECEKTKYIIVYPPTVDWNIPLFQRPQQLALELSDFGYLFLFSTGSGEYDRIDGFYKIKNNCYITNQYDLLIRELPNFVFMLSSTNLVITLENVIKIKDKILIVYEYIDEISQDISGPISINYALQRHEYMVRNSDIVIATADKLFDDVRKIREKDIYLIPNGVDYEHFHIQKDYDNIPEDISPIIKKGNPIIGYYGALAKWFDYDLIKEVAKKRPNYEIVLIGWDYDNSMHNKGLKEFKNIHYLGVKKYHILPKYAVWFDIATIPFVLNEITESTSPIKIFEYMALGKPIVTTDLRECQKYKSVSTGKSYEDFIEKIDKALKLRDDIAHLELLDKDAKENTWESRAKKIDDIVQEHLLKVKKNIGYV